MEKIVVIDGQPVNFKSTGATVVRYKAQFGRDFFRDLFKLQNVGKAKEDGTIEVGSIENIDFEFFYNFAWVLAKQGNKEIGDPITWLDTFDSFPIIEIIPEIQDLIYHTIQGKKK
ncbi:hypothetical protein AB1L05_08930 [Cytobacillus horneckiae]|uniref:hypothetical protein n=1 Tax=Cytobacillus horneckiae TaxID=549687 RepID=UPI0039A3E850